MSYLLWILHWVFVVVTTTPTPEPPAWWDQAPEWGRVLAGLIALMQQ